MSVDRPGVTPHCRSRQRPFGPEPLDVVERRVLERRHRVDRIGDAGRREEVGGDAGRRHEVVRGEHRGRVVQGAKPILEPKGLGEQLLREALRQEIPLLIVGRHGHRAPRDPLDRLGDVGNRLERVEGQSPGSCGAGGIEDVETPRTR